MVNKVYTWLKSQPGFTAATLDALGPGPGDTGLFCRGCQVLSRRQDILGNTLCRCRLSFLLAAMAAAEPPPLPGLEDLPVLGEAQTAELRQGRLIRRDKEGVSRYEAELRLEYTAPEEGHCNE